MNLSFNKSHDESSDEELVQLYKSSGDMEILGILFERYMELVYGVSLKYLKSRDEAKDVVMQIFENLAGSLMKHEVRNFKSWLHVSTKNQCLMELRKSRNKVDPGKYDDFFMEIPDYSNHDNKVELEEDLSKLEECIQTLKDEQKVCIELFYLKSKSYQEIESETSFPLKKVKSFIQNGKRNLKICMES